MPRYSILVPAFLLIALPHAALAAEQPYRATFIGDAFTGNGWLTGVRIELKDGWKTYWRMPGEAGIPPQFTWKTSVPAHIEVQYPLPGRFADASGETVGYKHEVVFPVIVNTDMASGVKLDLDLFFAVCQDICIPAQAKLSVDLGTAMRDPAGSRSVEDWQKRVPVSEHIATASTLSETEGKPELHLMLSAPVDDIFVETDTSAYFRAPRFSGDGREARLVIDNVKDAAKLKGAVLTITASRNGIGLDQMLTLP